MKNSKQVVCSFLALLRSINEQSHKKADMMNEDHCGVCDKMRYDYIEKNSHRDNEKNRNLNP